MRRVVDFKIDQKEAEKIFPAKKKEAPAKKPNGSAGSRDDKAQSSFLYKAKAENKTLKIVLFSGKELIGKIESFGTFSMLLDDGKLVFKHAVEYMEVVA